MTGFAGMSRRCIQRAAALACALAFLAGCGHSQKCDFDDRPRDDVWAAVVQTARAPR